MKNILIFLFLFVGGAGFGQSKPDSLSHKKEYLARINPMPDGDWTEGILYSVGNSFLMIRPNIKTSGISPVISIPFRVDAAKIDVLKLRYKWRKRNSQLIGISCGVALTTLVGIGTYSGTNVNQDTKEVTTTAVTVVAGIMFIGTGAIIGTIVGSASSRFRIRGSQKEFERYQNEIRKRAIQSAGGK